MNSKFGTALALSAVLLTGTAAAVINTQALVTPTKSSLGTAGTTLLPVDQVVSIAPGKTQAAPTKRIKPSAGSTNQSQVTNQTSSNQGAGQPLPAETTPAPSQPTTAPSSPTVIYGNPNPSTGGDDNGNDEVSQSNDGQGDEDQSNGGQSNGGDDD
jgi:hypothetical protein